MLKNALSGRRPSKLAVAPVFSVLMVLPLLAGCSDDEAASLPSTVSPGFLDVVAPISGDGAARANERSRMALARAASDANAQCMRDAGFEEFEDLELMMAADALTVHAFFVSPTKLERRGLVSVADRRLDEVPQEAASARGRCSGEGKGARAAAQKVDEFIVYRDGEKNPFGNWEQGVVAVEIKRIAESDDATYEPYRECFRQLGVPASDANDPGDAFTWALDEQNAAFGRVSVTEDALERWRVGEAVLDPDGGVLAKGIARCWRIFEEHLTPVLEEKRDAIVDEHRDAVLEGQGLLYRAIGGEGSMSREETNW